MLVPVGKVAPILFDFTAAAHAQLPAISLFPMDY
jgi:hypothetical protein